MRPTASDVSHGLVWHEGRPSSDCVKCVPYRYNKLLPTGTDLQGLVLPRELKLTSYRPYAEFLKIITNELAQKGMRTKEMDPLDNTSQDTMGSGEYDRLCIETMRSKDPQACRDRALICILTATVS